MQDYSQVNTGTTIAVKEGYDILITAALNSFTANGVNIPTSTSNQLYLSNSPLRVTTAVTNATVGTIFYYYVGNNSTYV